MLLEYGVSNYRSFNGYTFIDLHPAKSKVVNRYPGNFVELPTKERVLKDAVLVGENAGGKTNFIESLIYLRQIITRADRFPRSTPGFVNSMNLVEAEGDSDDNIRGEYDPRRSVSEQAFDISIALNDATYCYSLKINAIGIVSESLSYRLGKAKKECPVFSFEIKQQTECESCDIANECKNRSEETEGCRKYTITYNTDASDFDIKLIDALNDSDNESPRLTLVRLATLGEPRCKEVLDWFVDDLVISIGVSSSYLQASENAGELRAILESEEYLKILKLVDQSITELIVDSDKPFKDSIIVRRDSKGRPFKETVKEDSAGVRQFLYWAFYVYEVVYRNKTVVADEIDSMINPILSDKILAYINGSNHRGQFIFTTHNIFNLTLRTFMKEQINFVTKDPDTLESTLYSLADFDDVRYDIKEELYEFYMRGVLGGTADA